MFVPALRVCAALHLHQSQRNTAGSGQKIRSIVWRKLSSLYAADVQGIVRCVKMCVGAFQITATNHPGDDDGFDPVIDTGQIFPLLQYLLMHLLMNCATGMLGMRSGLSAAGPHVT